MRLTFAFFLLFAIAGYAEALAQTAPRVDKLSVAAFSEEIAQTDSAVVIDVRTPSEYAAGHLPGALNINWNGDSFEEHASLLDKSAPVFVYCRSGGRSNSAAEKLREMGFSQVFDMQGGMLAWREASLPDTGAATPADAGMDMDEYQALLDSSSRILVDFHADWCVPCIKMEPYLARIKQDMGDSLAVIRINIDENPKIAAALGITVLPVLMRYEHGEPTWIHQGYLDEESIRKQLLD